MKIKAIIFGVFLVFAGCYLQAQEFKIPQKTDLFQYAPQQIKNGFSFPYGSIYVFPTVRIWGWSTTGNIAYSYEKGIDGRGGTRIDFIIFNLVTDEIVISFGIDSFDIDENYDYDTDSGLKLYNLLKDRIINALRNYKIVEAQTVFSAFPIRKNNTEYSCIITGIEYKADDYGFFDNNISKYTVIINSNGKRKTLNTFTGRSLTRKLHICGYFLSPFENRALVVLAEEAFVFEGTELFYIFSGCNLGTGFN